MSKAADVIRAAKKRLDEETLAKARELPAYERAVIKELIDRYRGDQAEMMIRRFKAGWSVQMIISESMSLIRVLEEIQTKLTGESK